MEFSTERLESTLHNQVLHDLQAPLARIVHSAVRKAILSAAGTNDTKRPVSGGRCARVWDVLDKERQDTGAIPTLEHVRQLAKREHWNDNTARIQYYRWRSAVH